MLYMTIGLQGSGKTTYVEKYAPKDAVIISPDRIRNEMFHVNYDPAVEEMVWDTFFRQIELALRDKKKVIIDNTNVTRSARASIIRIARRYNVPVVGYWFRVPIEECLKRNQLRERKVPEQMIHNMQRMYNEPQLEEGFQEIKQIGYEEEVPSKESPAKSTPAKAVPAKAVSSKSTAKLPRGKNKKRRK